MTDKREEALSLAAFWEDFNLWRRGQGRYAEHAGDYPKATTKEIGQNIERTIAILRGEEMAGAAGATKPPPFGAWGAESWWPEWMR